MFINSGFLTVRRDMCNIHPLDLSYQTVIGTFNNNVNSIFVLNHIHNPLGRVKEVYTNLKELSSQRQELHALTLEGVTYDNPPSCILDELSLHAAYYAHQEYCVSNIIEDYIIPEIYAIIDFNKIV